MIMINPVRFYSLIALVSTLLLLPTMALSQTKVLESVTAVAQSIHVDGAMVPTAVSLPIGFPVMRVDASDSSHRSGALFLSNFQLTIDPAASFLMILDDSLQPLFSRLLDAPAFDFRRQPNGQLSYGQTELDAYCIMDSTGQPLDTIRTVGVSTDLHEFEILPNGDYLLLGDEMEVVDMTLIDSVGNPDAEVGGQVIEEIDKHRKVVFSWRGFDHFKITDATHEDFDASYIDFEHSNSVIQDRDGNFILSSRNLDEITKINRATGEIVWRWGGKHNQFKFVGDSIGFSHQHDVRRLPNGHITLFDNGTYHIPQFSRALEYDLDEVNMTATLVWQYRHSPDAFGLQMGSVQRLDNGNTVIGWGESINPAITEVRPDGSTAYEMGFQDTFYTYRAYRFPWPSGTSGQSEVRDRQTAQSNLAYPNPFRSQITMPISGAATAAMYDATGRVVLRAMATEGASSLTMDGSTLPDGVYDIIVTSAAHREVRKVIHVR